MLAGTEARFGILIRRTHALTRGRPVDADGRAGRAGEYLPIIAGCDGARAAGDVPGDFWQE